MLNFVDLGEKLESNEISLTKQEQPIEIGLEEVSDKNLYLKVYDFNSYENAKKIIKTLNIDYKSTTQKEDESYSILLGPLENIDVNKLVSSFISKGYKKTEIILK